MREREGPNMLPHFLQYTKGGMEMSLTKTRKKHKRTGVQRENAMSSVRYVRGQNDLESFKWKCQKGRLDAEVWSPGMSSDHCCSILSW